jgi:hypothetical protein
MSLVTSATCSYCELKAEFRIDNIDYELHACPAHKKTAITEFNVVQGIESFRMETESSMGFRAPMKITYNENDVCGQ